ncbi:MAG: hypothetical protein ACKOBF_04010, partial [Limnohabitans sp.]
MLQRLDAALELGQAQQPSGWDGRRLSVKHCAGWLQALKTWAQGPGDGQALEQAMATGWTR